MNFGAPKGPFMHLMWYKYQDLAVFRQKLSTVLARVVLLINDWGIAFLAGAVRRRLRRGRGPARLQTATDDTAAADTEFSRARARWTLRLRSQAICLDYVKAQPHSGT